MNWPKTTMKIVDHKVWKQADNGWRSHPSISPMSCSCTAIGQSEFPFTV
jgi:hypothetical protein